MSNPSYFPKTIKWRPSTVTLQNLYDFMESVENHMEEGEAKLYEYIESLEKCREVRESKLQIDFKAMLHNKFTYFQEEIQKQLDDKIKKKLDNKVEIMETRLHAMEIQKTIEQGEAYTIENIKLKDRIKELEEKVNHNLTINNIKGKIDIKPIKEEMNKLIALNHERNKRALNLINFCLKEEE